MGQYDTTLGAILLGVVFNAYLYGVLTVQFTQYCFAGVNDWRVFRVLLISVFVVDTAYTASAIYTVWFFAIAHYDDPAAMTQPVWLLEISPIPTAWSAFVAQLYFILRLWRLVGSKALVIVCNVLGVISLALAVWTGVAARITKIHGGNSISVVNEQMIVWLVTLVVTDCFITGSLSIALLRARTGVGRTDYLVYQVIRGAVQTGVFAGIFSLATLVTYVCLPLTALSLLFAIPTGRIYTSSLMYSLLLRADSAERCSRGGRSNSRSVSATTRVVQLTSAITACELDVYDTRPSAMTHPSESKSERVAAATVPE